MRFLERFCAPFSDVSNGEISHSDVRDLASLSDDSLGPPVSLSNVRFRYFKCVLKCSKTILNAWDR